MHSQLLDLPQELLIHILSILPFADILTCRQSCKFLYQIITDSLLLQYQIACQASGLENNPNCHLSISERLHKLRLREDAWDHFKVDFRNKITIPIDTTGIYDFAEGVYLVGELGSPLPSNPTTTIAIDYSTLPSTPHTAKWSRIPSDNRIIDVGLAVREHDLIALVTSTAGTDGNNATFCAIEIVLVEFSTGSNHPCANQHKIHVTNAPISRGKCAICVEIVGDYLALLVMYPHTDVGAEECIYIYEWKRGMLRHTLHTTHSTYQGLAFLSEDVLVLANRRNASLDIYRISTNRDTENQPFPVVVSLSLPALAQDCVIASISLRADPNPSGSFTNFPSPHRHHPFYSCSTEAIVLFNLRVVEGLFTMRFFTFVVHRRSLLAHLPHACPILSTANAEAKSSITPWSSWGPSVTRWFNSEYVDTRWITTSHGQRCVRIFSSPALNPSRIYILNFNPHDIQRYTSEQHETFPARFFSRVKRRLSVRSRRPEPSTCTRRLISAKDKDFNPHRTFMEDVGSSLPYIETASTEMFDFDAVLLDEERILGIRLGETLEMHRTIEVLHFGG